jgi:hypothetical protein
MVGLFSVFLILYHQKKLKILLHHADLKSYNASYFSKEDSLYV